MKHDRVKGDYSDIGTILGQRHREAGHILPDVSEPKRTFAMECAKAVKVYAPEIMDELRAASDATGWPLELLLAEALAYDYRGQCTVLAVSGEFTENGLPLFGRNHDWIMSILPYTTVLESNPTGSMQSLQFIETPGLSAGGVNEVGLAVGVTLVPRNTIKPQPGIAANLATRWILDHFTCVDEAVAYLKEIPHISGYTLLIADASGSMIRVELSPDKVVIGSPEDGLILATTHYLCEEMRVYENLDLEFDWTYERERRVRRWFAECKGSISHKDVQYVLGTHENGVCCHWEEDGEPAGTTWSWSASLGELGVHASFGPPCDNDYKPIEFPSEI